MSARTDKLRQHFELLCDEAKVTFDYHDEGVWHASYAVVERKFRYVYVPRIDSTAAYFVALHELGHTTQPSRGMTTLHREYDAWAGAGEVACVKANRSTYRRIAWSMLSYASDKRLKPYQPFYDLLALVLERK